MKRIGRQAFKTKETFYMISEDKKTRTVVVKIDWCNAMKMVFERPAHMEPEKKWCTTWWPHRLCREFIPQKSPRKCENLSPGSSRLPFFPSQEFIP